VSLVPIEQSKGKLLHERCAGHEDQPIDVNQPMWPRGTTPHFHTALLMATQHTPTMYSPPLRSSKIKRSSRSQKPFIRSLFSVMLTRY
jgi:hypothetical protein